MISKKVVRLIICILLCLRFWTEQIDVKFGGAFSALITLSFITLALILVMITGFKSIDKYQFWHLIIILIIIAEAFFLMFFRTPKAYEFVSIQQILKYLSYISVFVIAVKLFKTKDDYYFLSYSIFIGLGLSCFAAIAQKILGIGFIDVGGLRPYGFSSHPALFALQIVLSSSFLYCLVIDDVFRIKNHFLYIFILLALAALFLTQARTSWAVLFIIVFYYILKTGKFGVGFLFSFGVLSVLPFLMDRFEDLSGIYEFVVNEEYKTLKYYTVVESSFHWRLLHWYRLIEIAGEYQYFGHGPGLTIYLNEFNKEAHNSFVEFYVEQGVFGLIFFALLIISVCFKVFRSFNNFSLTRIVFSGYLIGVIFAMTFGQGVFNETHVMQMTILFYCYSFFTRDDQNGK